MAMAELRFFGMSLYQYSSSCRRSGLPSCYHCTHQRVSFAKLHLAWRLPATDAVKSPLSRRSSRPPAQSRPGSTHVLPRPPGQRGYLPDRTKLPRGHSGALGKQPATSTPAEPPWPAYCRCSPRRLLEDAWRDAGPAPLKPAYSPRRGHLAWASGCDPAWAVLPASRLLATRGLCCTWGSAFDVLTNNSRTVPCKLALAEYTRSCRRP